MSYHIRLQNMAFLKDTLIVVFYITADSWCRTNPGKTYHTYVSVDTNQRLLSNLMRGNCPLLQNILFPTHLAEQPKFWRHTMLLSQRKQQKTTMLLIHKYFHPNTSQAESSNFKLFQFPIVNDPGKIKGIFYAGILTCIC